MYVIKNDERGDYVARPGSARSYGQLDTAQAYHSKDEAQRNACGNETVIDVRDIMAGMETSLVSIRARID